MTYKKIRPAKQKLKLPASSTLDLSNISVTQDVAQNTICVYGISDVTEKLRKKLQKCGELKEVKKERDGLFCTFASSDEASLAMRKLHGKSFGSCPSLIVCLDYQPPFLVTGHKPNLFVVRDVPEEISIQEIWTSLKGDENLIGHVSFLRTSSRHIIIHCDDKKGQQALLELSGQRLGQWRLKVELWFEFCFVMTRRNLLLVENLPEDSTVDSVRDLLGVQDGIEYIEVIGDLKCALVYCKSKDSMNLVSACGQDKLKISLHQQVAGLRHIAFIDNLHETTKESDIHKLLRGCGNVIKLNVSLDQRTGLKRAVAYFESEEGAAKALLLNDSQFLGQTISVDSTLQKKTSKAVFITNLHRGAQELHLCLIFQDCGHIESVNIPKQKNIVQGREAGVVVFRDAESVGKALEKSSKSKIRGMRILVHREDPFEGRGKRGKSRKMGKILPSSEKSSSTTKRKKTNSHSEQPQKVSKVF